MWKQPSKQPLFYLRYMLLQNLAIFRQCENVFCDLKHRLQNPMICYPTLDPSEGCINSRAKIYLSVV